MGTPVEEQQVFQHITCHIAASEDKLGGQSYLSVETIDVAQIEVEQLDLVKTSEMTELVLMTSEMKELVLKTSKMKEIVLKKRLELEEVCKSANLEPDANIDAEKLTAVPDAGIVNPSHLLSILETHIARAKRAAGSRAHTRILADRWMVARDEEDWLVEWLEDSNKVGFNRFAPNDAHWTLKRAKEALAFVARFAGLEPKLVERAKSWEQETWLPLMFDGERLLSMLNDSTNPLEEKLRFLKFQEKVEKQILTIEETLFGLNPIVGPSPLSIETIDEQARIEVEQLDVLETRGVLETSGMTESLWMKSKMKELVLTKRLELEEVCKSANLEPDANTAADKLTAVLDAGILDPSVLSILEAEMVRVKGAVASRMYISCLADKWMVARAEEEWLVEWLEDPSKVENRFTPKDAHLNLKRAKEALAVVARLPEIVSKLVRSAKSWEQELWLPLMFDGVRLLFMLNESKNLLEEDEEQDRRLRFQEKVHQQILSVEETFVRPNPIVGPSSLSVETIDEAQIFREGLDVVKTSRMTDPVLKTSKMKELMLKKRLELEEVCKNAYLEPDANTAADKLTAVIDIGILDPLDLLSILEAEIAKAKRAVASRIYTSILADEWTVARDEEKWLVEWLEDPNKVENRFAPKDAHLNLKRAKEALAFVARLPEMVATLVERAESWEEEMCLPLMFDGVRLLSMVGESRTVIDMEVEQKHSLMFQEKVQEQILTVEETLFGRTPVL